MSSTRHIPVAKAGPAVRDVMLYEARTVPPDTPLAEVRETFANPHVKLLLVAEDGRTSARCARRHPAGGDGTIAPTSAPTPRA